MLFGLFVHFNEQNEEGGQRQAPLCKIYQWIGNFRRCGIRRTVVKGRALNLDLGGILAFRSLALWSWDRQLTYLNLSSHISKTGLERITESCCAGVKLTTQRKHSSQYLTQSTHSINVCVNRCLIVLAIVFPWFSLVITVSQRFLSELRIEQT